jgi:hypothetical protein
MSLLQDCMCAIVHLYMSKRETPEDVQRWFQIAIRDLWPIAMGSLSLRKSPCIRKRCQLCASGRGHSSYALYGRKRNQRFSIYVPNALAADLEKAIRNGRNLQELMTEAGRRYTLARKNERGLRMRK